MRSPSAIDSSPATREIVVTARLTIRDFRDEEPTRRAIADYLDIHVETETRESEWWLTSAQVLGYETRPARPLID